MIGRLLKKEEINLIKWVIKNAPEARKIIPKLPTLLVEEMEDGRMGSLRVLSEKERYYSRDIGEIEMLDEDGITLIISVNIDNNEELFELDIWKVDFSPLIKFPTVPSHA